MTAAIEVADLTKRYGGRTAVDGVTFTVPAGEFFGFQPALGTAAAFAGGLLLVDCTACLAVSRLFVRERLITGTRS